MTSPASQPARVTLSVASATDPGLEPEKQVNEDAHADMDCPIGHILVVCDGMGGHAGGKEASEAAIKTILSHIEAASPEAHPGAVLKAAIEHAGKVVYDIGGPPTNPLRPGSTAVAVLCHAGGSEVAHVGDSRAYLIRAMQIHAITRDHSMVQDMVDAGLLRAEEASRHPEANKITRALGMGPMVDVELRPTPLVHQRGDIFLLASDGLVDLVMPQDILNVVSRAMQTRSIDAACKQLVAMANARGGHDNITVQIGLIVDCPTCHEVPLHTVVDDDPMPFAAACDCGMLGSVGAVRATVVDDDPMVPMSTPSFASEVGSSNREALDASVCADRSRKRAVWLAAGMILLLVGVVMVLASVFSAWASMTMVG